MATSTAKPKAKKTTKTSKVVAADAVGAASGSAVAEPTLAKSEAKTRFNAALDEARAGAAALRTEATDRAASYRAQAGSKSGEVSEQAKVKAGELAVEGKAKASDAISALGKMVADNAAVIDENFGPKYGDYARNASRTLQENAARLEAKSVDELGEDAKEFVRKSPGLAVGIAAVGGYMLARIFRR